MPASARTAPIASRRSSRPPPTRAYGGSLRTVLRSGRHGPTPGYGRMAASGRNDRAKCRPVPVGLAKVDIPGARTGGDAMAGTAVSGRSGAVVAACCAIAGGIGLAVLAGWSTATPVMARVVPGAAGDGAVDRNVPGGAGGGGVAARPPGRQPPGAAGRRRARCRGRGGGRRRGGAAPVHTEHSSYRTRRVRPGRDRPETDEHLRSTTSPQWTDLVGAPTDVSAGRARYDLARPKGLEPPTF
jgi:hypothetical protein